MSRPFIATSRLLVTYETSRGTVAALDHPGLSIDGGTSLAVTGPSGCGKSTLLGLLSGLAVPTQGTITIGGTTLTNLSEAGRVAFRRNEVGMVYQADNLLPHLTVEENVAVRLAIGGGPAGANPPDVLQRLGLGHLAHRLPDQLSGGQRQRVAVARAIVGHPRLILADEPTGALDAASSRGVIELLLAAQHAIDATLVIVTHDPLVAARADRTEVLRRPAMAAEATNVG